MEAKGEKANETPAVTAPENPAPSGSKRKSRLSDVEPRTPNKRARVPVSRFQSPLEDLEVKFKVEKEEKKKDENITLYKKGAFLAVRGAEGTFYLCRTAQNVYSKSKRLRIQWLSLDSPPNIYKFDYVDNTEMETVLTEIKMDKVAKDSYKLPSHEQKRAEKILDRALRVEQGVATADEVEEEAMEEQQESSEEEEEEETPKKGRGRKSSSRGKKGKATPKKKETEKEKSKKKEKSPKGKSEKKKGPDRYLKPNPKIKILEKEPFFESKEKVPDISARITTQLIFRAVNLNDEEAVKSLLEKKEGVDNFDKYRAPSDHRTALEYAVMQNRAGITKLLIEDQFDSTVRQQRKRKPPPPPIISSMETGEYNPTYLGIRNIRALNVSRGSKEGNQAFLYDPSEGNIGEIVSRAMTAGVPVEAMENLIMAHSAADKTTYDEKVTEYIVENIYLAVLNGHRHLAAKYVTEAERLGGFGFNFLHKEVLNFEKEDLRDIILAASVRKKPFCNDAITPLHCAAINPNVKYLTRLLSIEPDINIMTRSRARPIHFAAACEGTGPLEFLLKRHASPNETDSSGCLPIHYSSRSGRSKNIDVLIKHAKAYSDVSDPANMKWGLGDINRPNRFFECPLHLAVQHGHIDVVRTLIKHGADINKPQSAGKNKVTPLMLAAQRGDLNIVRLLIQSGAAVEMLDKLKRSALTHAIINGCANVASYLLYLGADPNRVDSSGNSLVHYAAAYGWYFCLKLLIKDAGAKPDLTNDWQTTPISIAFLKGHHGIVDFLFNHKGVNIDFKNETGMTLCSVAASSRLVEGLDTQVGYLVNTFKADPTILDTNGYNALHHLAANNIKLKGRYWQAEVSPEAMAISVKIAEILIAAGCDPTLATSQGKTPIMLAIEQVNVDLVKFLVERGGTVSPNKNSDEKTVLHLMAEQCCTTDLTPMLKILAESKPVATAPVQSTADGPRENGKVKAVDAQQNEKPEETPMEVDTKAEDKKPADSAETPSKPAESNAVNGGDLADIKEDSTVETPAKTVQTATPVAPAPVSAPAVSQQEILKKMARDTDFLGFTPLLRACHVYKTFQITKPEQAAKREQALSFIKALVELAGSDVNAVVEAKNMPDEPEPHYVPEGKFSALHFMVSPVCEKEENVGAGLKTILKFAPNPNLRNLQNKTPLVLAVEASKETIVKALLEAGADPNLYIKEPRTEVTPLVLAAQRGAMEIMRLLIQYKADVRSKQSDNLQTPVHIMVKNRVREDETISMIQTLLQAGADINAQDISGRTPLQLAVISNKGHSDTSTSLEEFLLDCKADVFSKDKQKNMAVHFALDKNGVDPIELCSLLTSVMRDQRVDEPNENGFTPLLYAASSGATICCMHLLQRGANLEAKEFRGNTPLNRAIFGGFDSCAIMLMQRGASLSHPIVVSLPYVNEKKPVDEQRKRPLLTWRPKRQWENSQSEETPGVVISLFEGAIKNNLTGVGHMLLDAQGMPMAAVESALNLSKFYLALRLLRRIPDVNRLHAKNKDGQNLFHVLALKTSNQHPDLQIKVAGALLEKKVPIGERDNRGCTPLMYSALEHQSVSLAKFLISNDLQFNPRVKDNMNRDIIGAFMWDYAWVSDKFKVDLVKEWLEELLDHGHLTLDTLYDRPLPDPLLLGASLSCQQPEYFSTRNTTRTTPLIFTIRNYDFGLAKFMLQKGASPNFPDSDRLTPLMHAVRMNDVKMVKLLLNYNYDPQSDSADQTPALNLRPQLSKEQSRQVFAINFEAAKDRTPDDELDEEDEVEEDEAISLSKHTEEQENSVVLDDEEELEEDEEDMDNEDKDEDEEKDDEDNSDHDTDVMDDDIHDDDVKKETPALPVGATKLSLTRHVSTITKEREYRTIDKTSPVDLSLADSRGWTAVHHAVCSLDYATFDNAEIVYILGKAGAPLEAKNAAGETAMELAQKTGAEKIVKVLNKLLMLPPYNKEPKPFSQSHAAFDVSEPAPGLTKPDFAADAKEMLFKLDAAAGEPATLDNVPKPDQNCNIRSIGEVARSVVTNIPFDITLNKVDVSVGVYGMYNFYKLQIIRHKVHNMFVLFTRWGRIGDRGQFQHTPFQNLAEAAKEFGKIFRSKTGNDWNHGDTSKFVNQAKKYRLMPKAEKQHKQHKVDFDFTSKLVSKLPEPVFDLINEVSSVNMLLASIEKIGINEDFMPFGRMKRETLLEARKILTDISELIDKVTKQRNNLTPDVQAEYQSNCEEISKLTNEYYHLVPVYGFEYESIHPISEKKSLREHTKLLADLLDLQVANNILLGANLRKAEVHPLDYIYSSLGCRIQPLTEQDPHTQFILTNIHASVPTASINRVFKVAREGEEARLAAVGLDNHKLLWHGSSMSNFLSILSRGLLVTPPEVPWTGHLFGEGIYFADTFLKSWHYCHNHNPKSSCKVMLLCEVALGNPKVDVKHGDEDHLDDDINSLKILGMNAPTEDFDARMPFGASLSLGQIQNMVYHPPARISHNEYIVHNADQVTIRYLVLFNG